MLSDTWPFLAALHSFLTGFRLFWTAVVGLPPEKSLASS